MGFVTSTTSQTGPNKMPTLFLSRFLKILWIGCIGLLTAQVGIGSNDSTFHPPSSSGTMFIQEGTLITLSPGTEISATTSDGMRIVIRAKKKQVIEFRESVGFEAGELSSAILATGSVLEDDLEIRIIPAPAKHPPIARNNPPAVPKTVPARATDQPDGELILWTGPGSHSDSCLLTGTGSELCPCSFKYSALPETEPAFSILLSASRFHPDQETGCHTPFFLLPADRAPPAAV